LSLDFDLYGFTRNSYQSIVTRDHDRTHLKLCWFSCSDIFSRQIFI